MQTLKSLCCCLCLLALTAAAGCAGWLLVSARKVVEQVPGIIALQAQETRGAVLDAIDRMGMRAEFQLASTRADTVREIHETRRELSAHIVGLASVADSRLASMQSDVNLHGIAWHDMTERQLSRAIDGWVRVAQPASAVLAQAADAAPGILRPLVDCESNPSCFENRWRGLTFEAEQSMRSVQAMSKAWEKASPIIVDSARQFTTSAANVGANLDRLTKPRWYDRILGYGMNGAVIFRSLNPATNLTVKGAQIIASRP